MTGWAPVHWLASGQEPTVQIVCLVPAVSLSGQGNGPADLVLLFGSALPVSLTSFYLMAISAFTFSGYKNSHLGFLVLLV